MTKIRKYYLDFPPFVVYIIYTRTQGDCHERTRRTGLGYRGSLQVVNQIAPEHRRAEVVSSYFVCGFSGNALPVIGVGVISTFASLATASLAFAATISVFAVVALYFGIKYPS